MRTEKHFLTQSPSRGAKQYTILGKIALRPTVPPRSRNNYTASGLKTHLTFVAHLSQKNRRKVARKAGIEGDGRIVRR